MDSWAGRCEDSAAVLALCGAEPGEMAPPRGSAYWRLAAVHEGIDWDGQEPPCVSRHRLGAAVIVFSTWPHERTVTRLAGETG